MSEQLSAAAAALGTPEALVERSARARAETQGVTYEEILAAWSGGGSVPAQAAATPDPGESEAPAETPIADPAPTDQPSGADQPPAVTSVPAGVAAVSPPPGPDREAAPLLEGRRESLAPLLVGILGLLALAIVLVVAVPANAGGDDRHIVGEAALTELESEGRDVYLAQGCQYCHTQNVRPVIADVGLGAVTETGSRSLLDPPTFGTQRIGPDLAHFGGRLAEDEDAAGPLEEFLVEPGETNPDSSHPPYTYLSAPDLDALVAYLLALK